MPTRDTPFGAYNFIVEFDGNDPATSALGGFSDVSGIGTEITLMEYRQGNDKENRVRKIPALHKAGDVTLKRGIMGQVNFWQWIQITRADPTHKRTCQHHAPGRAAQSGAQVEAGQRPSDEMDRDRRSPPRAAATWRWRSSSSLPKASSSSTSNASEPVECSFQASPSRRSRPPKRG